MSKPNSTGILRRDFSTAARCRALTFLAPRTNKVDPSRPLAASSLQPGPASEVAGSCPGGWSWPSCWSWPSFSSSVIESRSFWIRASTPAFSSAARAAVAAAATTRERSRGLSMGEILAIDSGEVPRPPSEPDGKARFRSAQVLERSDEPAVADPRLQLPDADAGGDAEVAERAAFHDGDRRRGLEEERLHGTPIAAETQARARASAAPRKAAEAELVASGRRVAAEDVGHGGGLEMVEVLAGPALAVAGPRAGDAQTARPLHGVPQPVALHVVRDALEDGVDALDGSGLLPGVRGRFKAFAALVRRVVERQERDEQDRGEKIVSRVVGIRRSAGEGVLRVHRGSLGRPRGALELLLEVLQLLRGRGRGGDRRRERGGDQRASHALSRWTSSSFCCSAAWTRSMSSPTLVTRSKSS